ncbi:hypothetical protein H5410_062820 [Solanum commersonii]|uniref:Uncharacterized protein n=1 Tax=Solanum commersonii TaxID=4109 RepID=A0A9J5WDU4_SOLCO|nr:hypothetical protein H5410_062820 [Solanum commersonii]
MSSMTIIDLELVFINNFLNSELTQTITSNTSVATQVELNSVVKLVGVYSVDLRDVVVAISGEPVTDSMNDFENGETNLRWENYLKEALTECPYSHHRCQRCPYLLHRMQLLHYRVFGRENSVQLLHYRVFGRENSVQLLHYREGRLMSVL